MADLRCYLTKSGIAAENNAKQFGTTLKITEMVFDGSYLADEENPENLTEVINPVLTVPCSTSISDDGQTLTFKGSILVEQGGFNVWGIGLKTDSGVLYGYARSKGDKILTEDEGATESVRYAVDIITKNSDVIEIKVNQSTVYADLEDVDKAIAEHEAKPDPHSQYVIKGTLQTERYDSEKDYIQGDIISMIIDNRVYQFYCNKTHSSENSVNPDDDVTDTWREYPYKTVENINGIARLYYDGRMTIDGSGQVVSTLTGADQYYDGGLIVPPVVAFTRVDSIVGSARDSSEIVNEFCAAYISSSNIALRAGGPTVKLNPVEEVTMFVTWHLEGAWA